MKTEYVWDDEAEVIGPMGHDADGLEVYEARGGWIKDDGFHGGLWYHIRRLLVMLKLREAI
jgi:hypothetical protein